VYLGIDLGTSSVKAVLLDPERAAADSIVAEASAPLDVSRPRPLWSEQDPDDWWRAVERAVGALHERAPGFLLLAQNGAPLLDQVPEAAAWIDGLTQESLTWAGHPGAKWEDSKSGDRQPTWDRTELWTSLRGWRGRGVPIFTLDYARQPKHVEEATRVSRAAGFVPFVSRITLDRLP